MTQKNSTLLQKLKELAPEVGDNEEIVSNLIHQSNSDNNYESRDHIITKSTVIPVLICHTGYNSPTVVHSFENISQKRIGTIENICCDCSLQICLLHAPGSYNDFSYLLHYIWGHEVACPPHPSIRLYHPYPPLLLCSHICFLPTLTPPTFPLTVFPH